MLLRKLGLRLLICKLPRRWRDPKILVRYTRAELAEQMLLGGSNMASERG